MKGYKTVYTLGEHECSIEKSKFIGYATPIQSEEDAVLFIETIRKKHWNATHNVPVYIVGEDLVLQRFSDDGEPSGTAGVPVLEMLKKEGITNVCIVITRYFGGTKLGTGGLVRAYTQMAKRALEAAILVERVVFQSVRVKMDYHYHGKIQNVLLGMPEVILAETLFSEAVDVLLYVPVPLVLGLEELLVDITSGNLIYERESLCHLTLKNGELYP